MSQIKTQHFEKILWLLEALFESMLWANLTKQSHMTMALDVFTVHSRCWSVFSTQLAGEITWQTLSTNALVLPQNSWPSYYSMSISVTYENSGHLMTCWRIWYIYIYIRLPWLIFGLSFPSHSRTLHLGIASSILLRILRSTCSWPRNPPERPDTYCTLAVLYDSWKKLISKVS